ncbi:MAG: head decoration protein [Sporomusaceae bacterium]|nr:head decoration protein [Sporomusaceae bacterium]
MAMDPGERTIAVYEMIEIRAIAGAETAVAVRVAPTNTQIPVGTVLGQVTADKMYYPYDSAQSDGREKAKVVLGEPVAASAVEAIATAYIKGIFYKDKLKGLDEGAMVDLFARDVDGLIII